MTQRLAMALLLGLATAGALRAGLAQQPAKLANPASVNCGERGGTLHVERRPDGGEYGVCVFVDNHQCEEWAMLRGQCPVGGLRVTGYITPASRYCAITGGRYAVVSGSGTADERGSCSLPDGKVCDAAAYYAGSCPLVVRRQVVPLR
jgi:putative hemolysin